jgi:hypothetical protein
VIQRGSERPGSEAPSRKTILVVDDETLIDWIRLKDGSGDPTAAIADLERLNAEYEARFGFRFCVFVDGRSRPELVPVLERALTADRDAVSRLQTLVEATPDVTISADIQSGTITAGPLRIEGSLPHALRDAFVSGQWNPTAMLLDRFEEVKAVADRLPYIRGF